MTPRVQSLLRRSSRGAATGETGASTHGSIVLDYDELGELEIGELLDLMVARREKIVRSVDAVGKETATRSFDDAESAIEAIKAVIKKLSD